MTEFPQSKKEPKKRRKKRPPALSSPLMYVSISSTYSLIDFVVFIIIFYIFLSDPKLKFWWDICLLTLKIENSEKVKGLLKLHFANKSFCRVLDYTNNLLWTNFQLL